jgi:hypothetical protein
MTDINHDDIQSDARLWGLTGGYDALEEPTELGPEPTAIGLGVGEIALLTKIKHPNIARAVVTASGFLAAAITVTAVRHLRAA